MTNPKNRIKGLVAATFTPMAENGEVNYSIIGRYVDYLVHTQGVKNVFVNGTTGEWASLTVQERKLLAEKWVTEAKNKLDNVIVHVGSLNLEDAKDLARHAAELQVDGISVVSPSLFKPASIEALVKFLQEVASAAPNVPFYYYHIPELTGVNIQAIDLLDSLREKIPSLQGLKFTGTDLLDFGQCVQNSNNQLALLYGKDEQLLAALIMGATGAIGSTYNYQGKLMNNMLAAFEKKDYDLARQYQFQAQEFLHFAIKLGFGVAENKCVMSLVSGIPLGPPRLPLTMCTEKLATQFKMKLTVLHLI
ncbi:N-acetylneuraminate lyase isoform X1 [Latimeria chalumnae]|uniref:N-acetylneuraminate lyase n=1 Tax=Latimeria chalumnae TaxID=7897 RepID=H3B8H1_LATCH|nr:PREDICTED: N-acetylneuraminate lyase [Latimeria chalumnae]|eukprot:XP_005997488.1 PREDICTED: N-acetylneuraminate lyase [Latimeria chalumnae]